MIERFDPGKRRQLEVALLTDPLQPDILTLSNDWQYAVLFLLDGETVCYHVQKVNPHAQGFRCGSLFDALHGAIRRVSPFGDTWVHNEVFLTITPDPRYHLTYQAVVIAKTLPVNVHLRRSALADRSAELEEIQHHLEEMFCESESYE